MPFVRVTRITSETRRRTKDKRRKGGNGTARGKEREGKERGETSGGGRETEVISLCLFRLLASREEAVANLLPRRKSPRSAAGRKLSSPTCGRLLPGKGDPCVGHPAARISVVVRPVLFFQVLFPPDSRLPFFSSSPPPPLSLSLSPLFMFCASAALVSSSHVATGHRIVGAN